MKWLLEIGDKQEYEEKLGENYVHIPNDYLSNDVITDIYGEKFDPSDSTLQSKVIVAGKNIEVMELNNQVLERM